MNKASLAVVVLLVACERPSLDSGDGRSRWPDSALRATPGYVVDSALPPAELMRRFRFGLDSVEGLSGPATRELLVQHFFSALERRDEAALRALAVTRAEYAHVVFPGSRISQPPYNQPPEIAWLLIQNGSGSGLRRLIERAGGGRSRYVAHTCADSATDGRVRVYSRCSVRIFSNGEYLTRHFFGSIVEFGGRLKFLSFDNDY